MQSYTKTSNEFYTDKLDLKTLFTGSLPTDESLLVELGIDFRAVRNESTMVFDTLKIKDVVGSKHSSDLIGPIIFVTLFSIALTLKAKLHFGYIYMLCIFNSLGTYILTNLLCTESMGFTICCSILGYSFLPICIFSYLYIVLFFAPFYLSLLAGLLVTIWSTYVATKVICGKTISIDKTFLMGYPIFLGYFCYVMLVLF